MRTLRKALNLPVDTLPKTCSLTSNHWPNEHASRTSQKFLTDSGYSSRTNPHSGETMQSVTASRNGDAVSYSAALGFESSFNVKTSPVNVELNSQEHHQNSSKLYERSLKSSLDESETKRLLLLEKLREAHLAIQVDLHVNLMLSIWIFYLILNIINCTSCMFALFKPTKSLCNQTLQSQIIIL